MSNVIPFSDAQEGSFLLSVDFYRFPSGQIRAVPTFMPPDLIETTGHEVPDRMRIVAGWVEEGAEFLLLLAAELDEIANDEVSHDQ